MALDGECRVNIPWHDKGWGESTGVCCLLRKVDGLNDSNRCWWHIVANGGHGLDDWLCGGDPLWVADHFDGLDWHRLWWQFKARWQQLQRLKKMVVVAGIGLGVSHSRAGSWEAVQWLGMVVAMVAVTEGGPGVLCAQAESGQITRWATGCV